MKMNRIFFMIATILVMCFFPTRSLFPQEGVFFIDIESAQENLAMLQDEAEDLNMRSSILRAENISLNATIREKRTQAGKMENLYNQIVEKRQALEEISIHIQYLVLKAEVEEALKQNRETEGNLLVNLNGLKLAIKDLEAKFSENVSIITILEKRLAVNNESIDTLREAIEKSQSQSQVLKGFLKELDRLEQEIAPYIDEKKIEPQAAKPEAAKPQASPVPESQPVSGPQPADATEQITE